jgi:hypothetical protein
MDVYLPTNALMEILYIEQPFYDLELNWRE